MSSIVDSFSAYIHSRLDVQSNYIVILEALSRRLARVAFLPLSAQLIKNRSQATSHAEAAAAPYMVTQRRRRARAPGTCCWKLPGAFPAVKTA